MIFSKRKKNNDDDDEEENNDPFENFDPKESGCIHFLLLNRTLRILFVMTLLAVVTPCLIYVFVYSKRIQTAVYNQDIGTCVHNTDYHVPCGPINMTQRACLNTFCCFSQTNGCYHSLPSRHLYKVDEGAWKPEKVLRPVVPRTPRGLSATPALRFSLTEVSDSKLSIFVWNPSVVSDPANENLSPAKLYDQKVYPRGVIEVKRVTEPFETIFTTSRGPLIVSDNYFEWNVFLGSRFLYGLEEGELSPGYKKTLINTEISNTVPFIMAFSEYLKLSDI